MHALHHVKHPVTTGIDFKTFYMARFLTDADYDMQVKTEILRLLDGSTPTNLGNNYKLLKAERAAVKQIRHWIGNRVDCDAVFITPDDPDTRDEFVIMLTVDLTLYHLYSQTGNKDVPEHRQNRYDDALKWLKDVGRGDVNSELPALPEDEFKTDFRLNSRPVDDNEW